MNTEDFYSSLAAKKKNKNKTKNQRKKLHLTWAENKQKLETFRKIQNATVGHGSSHSKQFHSQIIHFVFKVLLLQS